MSWSFINNCWNCKKYDECPDIKLFQGAINSSHEHPEHNLKGGSGAVVVSCFKHEKKED